MSCTSPIFHTFESEPFKTKRPDPDFGATCRAAEWMSAHTLLRICTIAGARGEAPSSSPTSSLTFSLNSSPTIALLQDSLSGLPGLLVPALSLATCTPWPVRRPVLVSSSCTYCWLVIQPPCGCCGGLDCAKRISTCSVAGTSGCVARASPECGPRASGASAVLGSEPQPVSKKLPGSCSAAATTARSLRERSSCCAPHLCGPYAPPAPAASRAVRSACAASAALTAPCPDCALAAPAPAVAAPRPRSRRRRANLTASATTASPTGSPENSAAESTASRARSSALRRESTRRRLHASTPTRGSGHATSTPPHTRSPYAYAASRGSASSGSLPAA
eukprot:350556-Chlamydomonas_euryale.AAC.18